MPGGIELATVAERYMALSSDRELLSVACGTGELELYFAAKYGCHVTGIDSGQAFIARARQKAVALNLQDLATFEIGDGNAMDFQSDSFDIVFCSGALCAFFHNGLKEFKRVLRAKGKAVVIDVVWRKNDIPPEIEAFWSGGTAEVFTLDQNIHAFAGLGFRTIFSEEYHEPAWWNAYYEDMGDATHWQEEWRNYRLHQDYIGLGLFVIEKPDA